MVPRVVTHVVRHTSCEALEHLFLEVERFEELLNLYQGLTTRVEDRATQIVLLGKLSRVQEMQFEDLEGASVSLRRILDIEPSHIPRLTERFYRVDEARARQTGGAGLGLSIVKHALSHHQSKLEITSEVGVGSCFSFKFPKELVIENKLEKTRVNG